MRYSVISPYMASINKESEVVMSRRKCDQEKRAKNRGYVAGLKGHGSHLCPFETSKRRIDWLEGWRIGHGEHVQGFRNVGT